MLCIFYQIKNNFVAICWHDNFLESALTAYHAYSIEPPKVHLALPSLSRGGRSEPPVCRLRALLKGREAGWTRPGSREVALEAGVNTDGVYSPVAQAATLSSPSKGLSATMKGPRAPTECPRLPPHVLQGETTLQHSLVAEATPARRGRLTSAPRAWAATHTSACATWATQSTEANAPFERGKFITR